MSEATKQNWREEQAKAEIGHTDMSRALAVSMSAIFIALIVSVPVIQHVIGLRERAVTGKTPSLAFYSRFDGVGGAMAKEWNAADSLLDKFLDPNAALLGRIKGFQSEMDDSCFLTKQTAGPVQAGLCRLGVGNEKAFVGKDGWLFYEPGVRSLTGPAFLDVKQLRNRSRSGSENVAPPQPDPVKGVLHFRDQLKARGIDLIVVPVPVKPSIYPEKLSGRYEGNTSALQNESYKVWLRAMSEAGVEVFDPAPLLMAAKKDAPQYLKTDTHWRPEAMQMIAEGLASRINVKGLPAAPDGSIGRADAVSVTNLGDIAVMLKLPADQKQFADETVIIQPVDSPDGKGSQILLLGDSFANIYSFGEMGWGADAGLGDQLAFELKTPVDRIVRNDSGAFATREQLAMDMMRGEDRLAGKKVVVWEFAARELAVGNWKLIDLVYRAAKVGVAVDPSTEGVLVSGAVGEVSERPIKGALYKDFIMKLYITGMVDGDGNKYASGDGVVHFFGMRNREILPVAAIQPGTKVNLRIQPWGSVMKRFGKMKRGTLDDMMLEMDKTLYWGEKINDAN